MIVLHWLRRAHQVGNIENAEKILRKFKKYFCREQQGGIVQNVFLQGTARRPEARPEGRGREEERKAPSYGNSFYIYIIGCGNSDFNDDGGGGNVVGGRIINYQKVMTMHCTHCKR